MQDITNITNEKDGDIIFVTVAKYKLFMSYGKIGIDAYCLYSHLMFTARLQETNQVFAKDCYLRQGLNWGKDRVQKAKQLLIELELISEIINRDKKGQFVGKYIKVKTKTTPFEIDSIEHQETENPQAGKPDSGQTETNALTNNDKCLNEKKKCLNEKKKCLNGKKRQSVFTIPSLNDILSYISDNSLSVDGAFFLKYYTESNWIDSNGKKVINWKLKLLTWDKQNKTYGQKPAYKKKEIEWQELEKYK
jgi:hypothetical protein